jgi:glycosyltransferase involved in cell wall biosynthesis
MRVSIIIPVKDDERLLRCIDAVMQVLGEADEAEVFVVDNGSPPSFEAVLSRLPPAVTLLREQAPGAYAARNRAIACATGDVLFFTDADAVVRPGWIKEGLRAIADGADVAAGYSGSLGDSRLDRLIQAPYEAMIATKKRGDRISVDCRNVAVRRPVLAAVPFDARFSRGGDGAFGRLATRAGYRVFYAPDMVVDHDHEHDLFLWSAKRVCWGWNSARLGAAYPDIDPPPGPWMLRARRVRDATHLPVFQMIFWALWLTALLAAALLTLTARYLPFRMARVLWDGVATRCGRLAGTALYATGHTERQPIISELLHRRLRRD